MGGLIKMGVASHTHQARKSHDLCAAVMTFSASVKRLLLFSLLVESKTIDYLSFIHSTTNTLRSCFPSKGHKLSVTSAFDNSHPFYGIVLKTISYLFMFLRLSIHKIQNKNTNRRNQHTKEVNQQNFDYSPNQCKETTRDPHIIAHQKRDSRIVNKHAKWIEDKI